MGRNQGKEGELSGRVAKREHHRQLGQRPERPHLVPAHLEHCGPCDNRPMPEDPLGSGPRRACWSAHLASPSLLFPPRPSLFLAVSSVSPLPCLVSDMLTILFVISSDA